MVFASPIVERDTVGITWVVPQVHVAIGVVISIGLVVTCAAEPPRGTICCWYYVGCATSPCSNWRCNLHWARCNVCCGATKGYHLLFSMSSDERCLSSLGI